MTGLFKGKFRMEASLLRSLLEGYYAVALGLAIGGLRKGAVK